MVESSFLILSFEPCPILIMAITAATPMMMPSILRKDLILLLATAFSDTFIKFRTFIVSRLVV